VRGLIRGSIAICARLPFFLQSDSLCFSLGKPLIKRRLALACHASFKNLQAGVQMFHGEDRADCYGLRDTRPHRRLRVARDGLQPPEGSAHVH
jgi:hypothetical protein